MERNLKEALKHRRSYYAIDNQTTIPDAEIEEILDFAALHTPSAFNSQSTRMVLLLREQHRRLWDIVRNTLKKTIPAYLRDASAGRLDYARGRRIRSLPATLQSSDRRRGYCHLEITCHLGIDCTDAFRFTAGTTPKERIQTFMRQGKGI